MSSPRLLQKRRLCRVPGCAREECSATMCDHWAAVLRLCRWQARWKCLLCLVEPTGCPLDGWPALMVASPTGMSGFSKSLQCYWVWVRLKALLCWEYWKTSGVFLTQETNWLWIFLTRNLIFFSAIHGCNFFPCYLLDFCYLHLWMHVVKSVPIPH